jgi:hypothetical protein
MDPNADVSKDAEGVSTPTPTCLKTTNGWKARRRSTERNDAVENTTKGWKAGGDYNDAVGQ